MEIRNIIKHQLKGTKRAQLFTLTTLIFFILMLSVLFSFAIINTQYYEQQQTASLSNGAINLVSSLNSTASTFGNAALKQALSVLTYYEYNASLRDGNLISNLSKYLSYLVANGMLPNVISTSSAGNYLKTAMGNLTFSQYNNSLIDSYSQIGLQIVNESNFLVSQNTPYAVTISYLENIAINQTGDLSRYSIPITVIINITGTPDLFYAQQGILSYITFGNLQNITSILSGSPAIAGSLSMSSYGTVDFVANNGCPSYTTAEESSIILVANQLSNLATCANNFAGVILNVTGLSPQVPYLIYSANTVLSSYFKTGENVELYGPQLEALNIQNLITAASNNYYFSSPFTSSYIGRSEDSLNTSNSGIFTFSGFNRLAASFNSLSSYITVTPSSKLKISTTSTGLTLNTWVMTSNSEAQNTGILSTTSGCGYNLLFSSSNSILGTDGCGDSYIGNYNFIPNVWYDIALTISSGATPSIKLYVNGNAILSTTGTWGSGTSWSTLYLGSNVVSGFLNGTMANVQIYSSSLSQNSITELYHRGINGLPIADNLLSGWFTLNGNNNDLSGFGSNAVSSNVIYTQNTQGTPSANVSYFNGVTSYLELSPSLFGSYPTSGSTTSYAASFAVWFKTTDGGVILGQESSPPGTSPSGFVPAIYVGTNGDVYTSLFYHGLSSYQIISPDTYNNGQWHFLVDTYNNGQETLYIDGKEIGTQSQPETGYSSVYYYQLGTGYGSSSWSNTNSGWFSFNGNLANVQTYGTSLSHQQVLTMYSSGLEGSPVSFNGLTAWLPLNGNINNLVSTEPINYPVNILFGSFNGSAQNSFISNSTAGLMKIPGLLSCTSTYQCYNSNSSGLYINNAPLEFGSKSQTAYFNSNAFISSNVPLNGNIGVSFWLRLNGSASSAEVPLSFSGTNGIIISTSSGVSTVGLTDGSNVLYANTLTSGTWAYVAATNSGSSYTIYMNGNPGNTEVMGTISMGNLTLGKLSSGTEFFNGSIADLQIYSNTITSAQALQLYGEGIAGAPFSENVVAWFPLTNNCDNYTYSVYNCYLSRNVTYPYFSGNYLASGYPPQVLQNGWQALGFGASPP